MKALLLSILLVLPALCSLAQEEQGKAVPQTQVADLQGRQGPFPSFLNADGPTVVSFWATWCKPCIQELTALEDQYASLVKDKKLRVLAVSIDDARSQGRVSPFVASRGWPYTILLDPNADLKRAMNVVNVPHTFLIDKQGRIVWQHASYNPGDEEELADQVRKLP